MFQCDLAQAIDHGLTRRRVAAEFRAPQRRRASTCTPTESTNARPDWVISSCACVFASKSHRLDAACANSSKLNVAAKLKISLDSA